MGVITLSVLAGKAPKKTATMVDFLVVKAPSLYNVILGHPTLNNLRAVTFTYHLKMKFPTDLRLGEVHGKQLLARECYTRELRHEVKVVVAIGEARPPSPFVLAKWDEEVRDELALWQAKPNELLELGVIICDIIC